jgi:hypothetical protein
MILFLLISFPNSRRRVHWERCAGWFKVKRTWIGSGGASSKSLQMYITNSRPLVFFFFFFCFVFTKKKQKRKRRYSLNWRAHDRVTIKRFFYPDGFSTCCPEWHNILKMLLLRFSLLFFLFLMILFGLVLCVCILSGFPLDWKTEWPCIFTSREGTCVIWDSDTSTAVSERKRQLISYYNLIYFFFWVGERSYLAEWRWAGWPRIGRHKADGRCCHCPTTMITATHNNIVLFPCTSGKESLWSSDRSSSFVVCPLGKKSYSCQEK